MVEIEVHFFKRIKVLEDDEAVDEVARFVGKRRQLVAMDKPGVLHVLEREEFTRASEGRMDVHAYRLREILRRLRHEASATESNLETALLFQLCVSIESGDAGTPVAAGFCDGCFNRRCDVEPIEELDHRFHSRRLTGPRFADGQGFSK